MRNECPVAGPGAGVALVRDGRIVHAKDYGLANVEWKQPISPTTLFAIGSLTKQFTAVAVCMLHDEGELDLDGRLNVVLPDYAGANGEATVRQLLHHTSGIRSYTPRGFSQSEFRRDVRVAELLTLIQDLPAAFAPGERYQYSNSGYVLLGAAIERASGLPYRRFIESRIFAPLQMSDSCLLLDGPVRARRGLLVLA